MAKVVEMSAQHTIKAKQEVNFTQKFNYTVAGATTHLTTNIRSKNRYKNTITVFLSSVI